MTNIILRKSSKMIVDVRPFKEGTLFKIEFLDYRKTWKTYLKDWVTRDELEKTIKFVFVEKKDLWSDFEKLDSNKICQELKGKSLLITTSIWD